MIRVQLNGHTTLLVVRVPEVDERPAAVSVVLQWGAGKKERRAIHVSRETAARIAAALTDAQA